MNEMVLNTVTIALMVESIVLHEVAHGYAAGKFGDHTARFHGRITLNPIPHIDPMWTIVVPIAAFLLSGGSFIIGKFAGWATLLSPKAIVLAVGFSAAIGIFFGFYPAHKASKLLPIEALRYE